MSQKVIKTYYTLSISNPGTPNSFVVEFDFDNLSQVKRYLGSYRKTAYPPAQSAPTVGFNIYKKEVTYVDSEVHASYGGIVINTTTLSADDL